MDITVGSDFYAMDCRQRKRHWYVVEIDTFNGQPIFGCCLYFLRKRKRPAMALVKVDQMPSFQWFKESEIII